MTMTKRHNTHITKVKNESGDITASLTEVKLIERE
jgi:hypothetical protein